MQVCDAPPISPDNSSQSDASNIVGSRNFSFYLTNKGSESNFYPVGPKVTSTDKIIPLLSNAGNLASQSNASANTTPTSISKSILNPASQSNASTNATPTSISKSFLNPASQSNALTNATLSKNSKSILKASPQDHIPISKFSWLEPAINSCQPDNLVIKPPRFIVYKDTELVNTERAGDINKLQTERLIRTTITNMQTELTMCEYPRTPSDEELIEMGKALTITYPSLLDDFDSPVSYWFRIQ